jgi:hypothetical protein
MIYTHEVFDRTTGELVTLSDGDWITIAELGALHGLGRRQTTEVLRVMDVLQIETKEATSRHRLAEWFVKKGYGKRLHRKHDRYPFDVLSPSGQQWIEELWPLAIEEIETRKKAGPVAEAMASLKLFKEDRKEMSVEMEVYWLADHFPMLTETQMATVLSVSQPLVHRYLSKRQRELKRWREWKAKTPLLDEVRGSLASPLRQAA